MQPTIFKKRKLRQLTKAEADGYELIGAREAGDKYPVVIKGLKYASPPPPPDDIFFYNLKETTKVGDSVRSWEWVPVMTPDEE